MSIARGTFETVSPSRFITFSFPNSDPDPVLANSYADPLRIAVLDSPLLLDPNPQVAALLVPKYREHDWLFSTEYGHLQLLANSADPISRLILVGDTPCADFSISNETYTRPVRDDTYRDRFQRRLLPLLLALCPKSAFENGVPKIPFVTYEDNILRSVTIFRCCGSVAGEMLVEDVEIEVSGHVDGSDVPTVREFRRRLRFKRMPNLVQTEIRIVPVTNANHLGLGEAEFRPELGVLVHSYLPPMVAGLSVIAPYLEEQVRAGTRPRALCIGLGGGALLTFLRTQLGFFDLLGVEVDEMVFRVAWQFFGLVEDEHCRVCIGDGIRLIESFAGKAAHRNSVSDERVFLDISGTSESGRVDSDIWHQWGCNFHGSEAREEENTQFRWSDDVGGRIESLGNSTSSFNPVHGDFQGGEVGNVETGRWDRTNFIKKFSSSSNLVSDDLRGGEFGYVEMDQGMDNFDVVMVDLDSNDARTGLNAPPLEFIQKRVILATRFALSEHGILVINVIPVNESFYDNLISSFREFFCELYEIDVGNGENFVLIATVSPVMIVRSENSSTIWEKLRKVIDSKYIDCMRKL